MVPALRRFGVGEFDDDDPLRLGGAFEQVSVAAAHDIAPAEAGDAGCGERRVGFVSGRVSHLNVGDHISGHSILLSAACAGQHITAMSVGLPWPRRSPHAARLLTVRGYRRWQASATPRLPIMM